MMAGGQGGGAIAGDAVVTGEGEMRSLALTPTWSVATVLTLLVAGSLLIERSIHRLSNWLKKTHQNPLYKAMEKMKEEMMLLGFISLLLAATSRIISGICIYSKYYNSKFSPCTKAEVEESLSTEHAVVRKGKRLMEVIVQHSLRRNLEASYRHLEGFREGYESFVSHEGLEQLHRFIFIMAVTHVTYSCLTMLLAILKIHKWRKWEDEAFRDNHESFSQIAFVSATRRQPALAKSYSFRLWSQNDGVEWLFCFIAQFSQSVVRADYLILRKGFIMTHNLSPTYDFHNYMMRSMEEEFEKIVGVRFVLVADSYLTQLWLQIHNLSPIYDFHNYMMRSMEEEFEKIAGVSGVLWGFVIAFMLFNIDGSNLYFWIAILPVALVLVVGAKLQYVIATLTAEGARMTAYGPRIKPRDDLFWLKKPEFLLWLIHFILFQWQFGYDSCFIKNRLLVYGRLILGFAGQFLCSYSTLPVYALVTQMGSKYKAALIPRRIRETIHGWGKATRKRRRRRSARRRAPCALTDEPAGRTCRWSCSRRAGTVRGPSSHRASTPCRAAPPSGCSVSEASSPSNQGGRVTRSASMPGIASLRTGANITLNCEVGRRTTVSIELDLEVG